MLMLRRIRRFQFDQLFRNATSVGIDNGVQHLARTYRAHYGAIIMNEFKFYLWIDHRIIYAHVHDVP